MVLTKNIQKLRNSLNTDEAIENFKEDPLAHLQTLGYDFSKADDPSKEELKNYIKKIHFPSSDKNKIQTLTSVGDWFACAGCKVGVGATITGIATAIVAICVAAAVGTGGEAVVEEVALEPVLEAGAGEAIVATVAVETGLTASTVAKIFAAAFVAGGAGEFVGYATDSICQATGACSD